VTNSASGALNQQRELVQQFESEDASRSRCLEAQFASAYRFGFNAAKNPVLFGVEIVSAGPYLMLLVCMTT
jgi:hypothetical protein